ncbi:SMEK domain-containing protein [Mucilaginibacter sp. UYCu711]|uniref:SMEK domain-containing protein n=1 Tax=Mucilaginibacter sp. UYCu711 TaxID=3156339 RepID=UPI003D1F9283
MTNSQRLFADISRDIAILRVEISQAGKRGLTDIHKRCENLMKHMLNRVYGLQLINLNCKVTNFQGLDLGDDAMGLAYQISSEKTSAKVNDMLEKVLHYAHYGKFPHVRLFVLGDKQKTYAVNVQTTPFFTFDWKQDVLDFDDLLKVIEDLDLAQLTEIYHLLDAELPYTVGQLREDQAAAPNKIPSLINIDAGLAQSKMPYYQHTVIKLRFLGLSFSPADLYKGLEKFYAEGNKRDNLYLFDPNYRKPSTAHQIDFYDKLYSSTADYFKEGALRITPNQIVFETASYSLEELKLTPLITEVLALTTLVLFCKQLYGYKKIQAQLDFELSSTNKVCLIPQNSHLHLINSGSFPILNPSPLVFTRSITDISNDTLNGIYKAIIHGFVTEGNYSEPFADLNETAQNPVNDWFRNYFGPTLQDLDD